MAENFDGRHRLQGALWILDRINLENDIHTYQSQTTKNQRQRKYFKVARKRTHYFQRNIIEMDS